jgi:hypothetical protein
MTPVPPLPDRPPGEIVAEAADHVAALAAKATPGTWSAFDMTEYGHRGVSWVEATHDDQDATTTGCVADLQTVNAANDARWIAALSPQVVASGLEHMLRQAAMELRDAWPRFEPGTIRFVILTDEHGMHDGSMGNTLWTEQSRWEAIQPRWGGAIDVSHRILAARTDPQADTNTATTTAEGTAT